MHKIVFDWQMDGKQRCPKQNIDHYQFAIQLKTEAGLQDVTWMCRSFALGVYSSMLATATA